MLGCGFEGKKLYYQMYRKGIKIECVLDNKKTGLFHGKQICNVEEMREKLSQYYILVSTEKFYKEIKDQLESCGLEEIEDFCIGRAYGKKLMVINANCYGTMIKRFLISSREFDERYYIYPSREVQSKPELGCDEVAIRKCDVLLTQDIKEDNPFGFCYAEAYVKGLITEKCICMVIPNLVGMGKCLFLQAIRGKDARVGRQMFPYDDVNVQAFAEMGMDEETIIKTIINGGTYTEKQILDNFNGVIEKYKKREEGWDIKIVDFILEKYKEEKVFYENDHCTNIVHKRITQEILKKLDIFDKNISCTRVVDDNEMPIYPEVRKVLGLKYGGAKEFIREHYDIGHVDRWKILSPMDLEEWLNEYIYWNEFGKTR